MRIKINIYAVLILFIFANILVFGGIFYIASLSSQKKVIDIPAHSRISNVVFLEEDISKLAINSRAFIIYEPDSRTVVEGKNEHLRFAPASSTKIMTATVSLKEYPLNKIIASDGVSRVLGSRMGLFEGELITVENLLYGLMLPSGNDAAYVLAKDYIGGHDMFVRRMNDKAKELGLVNTFFVDPAGLDDDNYSTAFDLARLASYAMENENFRKVVRTREKIVTDLSGNITHKLSNLNELLALNGVIGIKTGFTEEAGGVLVTGVEKGNRMYIIVVLNTPDRFSDTRQILTNVIENIKVEAY